MGQHSALVWRFKLAKYGLWTNARLRETLHQHCKLAVVVKFLLAYSLHILEKHTEARHALALQGLVLQKKRKPR